MESKFEEIVKNLSSHRRNLIQTINSKISLNILTNNVFIHTSICLATVVIIVSIFGTTRALNLFSFHPLCMTIGTILCIGEGIITYKNHFMLESLSPIMQHNKKIKVRTIHQTFQMLGFVFIILGLLFIIAQKLENKKSLFPMTIHSVVSSIALILLFIQVLTGTRNYFPETLGRINKWHDDFGLLIWDVLVISLFTGLVSFLNWTFSSFLILFIPLLLWIVVVYQIVGKNIRRGLNGKNSLVSSSFDQEDDSLIRDSDILTTNRFNKNVTTPVTTTADFEEDFDLNNNLEDQTSRLIKEDSEDAF